MGVKTWAGSTDDWETAGNWAEAAIPVDGDDVIFPGTSSQSVLSNVDQSDVDLNLHSIFVAPGFGGDIGTSASPLKCVVGSGTNPSVRHYGSKPFYFSSESDLGVDDTDTIIINSPNRDGAMEIGCTSGIGAILIGRGAYTLKATATGQIDNVIQSFTRHPESDTKGTIESGANDIQSITVHGGTLTDNDGTAGGGADASIRVLGGRYVITASTGTFYLYIGPNGMVDHRGGGTLTAVHLAGLLTFENSSTQTTITDLFRIGGQIRYDEELITITADHKVVGV